ncbi:tRNA (cytidine(34)-2'-O)-methyltransferase [Oligoflexia bacterium]|nr:tRNA (cytidine(34)-2'-O)-methyltransferase [Oligoflexia bacterium]
MDIVLVNPEIPQNTGSIARTCAATETPLHLVGKLGFDISEKSVRRAGLDYWPYVKLHEHAAFKDYMDSAQPKTVWLFSKFASKLYTDVAYDKDDALVFGSETKGLGQAFLSQYPTEQIVKIPMTCKAVRSLNLSNAVSIALYEALRQQNVV